jgi:hypothetical protein
VQLVADPIMAAVAGDVFLVVPAALFKETRDCFPPDPPLYIMAR